MDTRTEGLNTDNLICSVNLLQQISGRFKATRIFLNHGALISHHVIHSLILHVTVLSAEVT